MATLPKEYKNKAIVQLKKLGWTFYALQKAFEMKDKRNLLRVWKRDCNKYFLPSEKNGISKGTSIK